MLLVSIVFSAVSAPAQHSAQVIPVSGDTEYVHDPSIIKDGNTWYVFNTANGPNRDGELPVRCSPDLHEWKKCGNVFAGIPEWIKKNSPKTRELWAPDISYFNGEYRLYYAFSVFGKNTSGIALATNRTLDPHSPDFHWEDRGLVLRSRAEDNYNAIDPNLVQDGKGGLWLAFGSFWDGIKMRRVDVETGKLSSKDTKLYSLARRKQPKDPPPNPPGLPGNWQAIEAPFIVHHDDYFYLFVSFDLCCRGTKSNYKTMVGRASKVTGPYVDAAGIPMLEGGGTPVLLGNNRWFGPGGESIRMGNDHGMGDDHDLIVFHAYDGKTGDAYLHLSSIDWTGGWPHVALEGGNSAPWFIGVITHFRSQSRKLHSPGLSSYLWLTTGTGSLPSSTVYI
jgi:arabinan endo-1,5-alpha-L-arabinosidase